MFGQPQEICREIRQKFERKFVEKFVRKFVKKSVVKKSSKFRRRKSVAEIIRQKLSAENSPSKNIRRKLSVKNSPSKIIRQKNIRQKISVKNPPSKIRSRNSPSKFATRLGIDIDIRLRNESAEACHPEARPRTLFPEDLYLYRMRCSPRKPGPKVSFDSRACRQCVLAGSF